MPAIMKQTDRKFPAGFHICRASCYGMARNAVFERFHMMAKRGLVDLHLFR